MPNMLRPIGVVASLLWLALFATPGHAQDQSQDPAQAQPQPSLADVARQARRDREKNAAKPKTIITDENMPSSKGLTGLAGDLGGGPQGGVDSNAMAKALAKVQEAEAGLKQLESLDRATLAKAILLDNDVDFPSRRAWEDKLYAAKEHFVSHEGQLIVELKQIVNQVQSWQNQGKLDPKDPRAQQMKSRLVEIVQDAIRTEQDYRAVVMEGWDLAKQAKH
ncbi:MAG TPA: hypothetical protein VJN92_00385 [Candidatus Acidoferrum sp.]|nr:hypothetical protein [Candidatus Acidoferrum sp.]